MVGGPDLVNRGFVHEESSAYILEEGRLRVIQAVKESSENVRRVTDINLAERTVTSVSPLGTTVTPATWDETTTLSR